MHDGGRSVTMERLFGLVNVGTTQSASRLVSCDRRILRSHGMGAAFRRRGLRSALIHTAVHVGGLRAVDADDDRGRGRQGELTEVDCHAAGTAAGGGSRGESPRTRRERNTLHVGLL